MYQAEKTRYRVKFFYYLSRKISDFKNFLREFDIKFILQNFDKFFKSILQFFN